MKKLRTLAILIVLMPAALWAQGVRVGPALSVIPGILERAVKLGIPDRFPEQWQALKSLIERDRLTLEALRGPQLWGEKAIQASRAIDHVDLIRRACLALERTAAGAALPAEVLEALSQKPAPEAARQSDAPHAAVAPPPVAPVPPPRATRRKNADAPPAPVKAPASGPIASAEEIQQLQKRREDIEKYLNRRAIPPAPQTVQALNDADRLLDRAHLAERTISARDVNAVIDELRAADPCVDSERKADWVKETGEQAAAVALYSELAKQDCLDPSIARNAQEFVNSNKSAIAPPVHKAEPPEAPREIAPVAAPAPEPAHVPTTHPSRTPAAESTVGVSHDVPRLGLDVWQSAWGNFSELSLLVDYAKRNSVTAVNLNPGRAVTADTMRDAYLHLRPLVATLRSAGVREINYLYAELGYPIANYAEFLRRYPDLGIGTIVDDSEFTDDKWRHFEENLRTVRANGLKYSAFITLESVGNSGVSDEMRNWAVDNIDQPILMSYFGCTFEEQRDTLEKYLDRADAAGHAGTLRIAILLGGKSVGRERSCEQQLHPAELRKFLSDIDVWARHHRSYGGLILETNLRLPKNDIGKTAGF